MRIFCLLLILGNVLFLSWASLIDVHVSNLDRSPVVNVAPPPRIHSERTIIHAASFP